MRIVLDIHSRMASKKSHSSFQQDTMRNQTASSALNGPHLVEIIRRLQEAYQPQRIYLFGSAARGETDTDSDFDLMIIVPDDAPVERHNSRLAYEVLRGTGVAADVLVATHSYFENRRFLKASLPGIILREGRLLFDKG